MGSVLLLMAKVNAADAETCFKQSFEVSSMQGSRARQLRTATDLASLSAAQGRPEEVRALLRSEGFDTSDLTAAESVLAGLRSTNLSRTCLGLGLRHAFRWQTAPRPVSAAV